MVLFHVKGMIFTKKLSLDSLLTVKLTPSTHIDPFFTIYLESSLLPNLKPSL